MIRPTFSWAFLRAARRRVGLPLLGLCAGLAGAYAVTTFTPPTYRASATVMVVAGTRDDSGGVAQADIVLAQNLAPTIARLAESGEVARATAAALGLPERSVDGQISSSFELGMQIVTITASARTGSRAASVANAAVDAVTGQIARLRIAGESAVTAQPLDLAGAPSQPTSPKPSLNSALGALAGLLVGLGLASLRDRLDGRLRGLTRIEAQLGLPILGVFPRLPRRFLRGRARVAYARPGVRAATDAAVAAVTVLTTPLPRRRLLVTSVHDDDRTALVTGILALGLAGQAERVTLVEGQLNKPVIAGYFPDSPGHTLQEAVAEGDPAQPGESTGLSVLPADPVGLHLNAGSVRIEQIGALIDMFAARGDIVISNAPPVLAGRELAELAQHADGVLLVVYPDSTGHSDASRASLLVQRLGVPLVGVLVVGAAGERADALPSAWPAITPRREAVRGQAALPTANRRDDLTVTATWGDGNTTVLPAIRAGETGGYRFGEFDPDPLRSDLGRPSIGGGHHALPDRQYGE
ncbi:hypothetical protein OG792_17600 [Micromonospora sp. NBC_01699]|uniref:hypothetical protein n=1 Tax=Micromonospora sp. NBC_01699 TaxID=2975984 RepID=UPI002E339F07|nr:hypothetical protein [Micromonospora sp. NBC_01699]